MGLLLRVRPLPVLAPLRCAARAREPARRWPRGQAGAGPRPSHWHPGPRTQARGRHWQQLPPLAASLRVGAAFALGPTATMPPASATKAKTNARGERKPRLNLNPGPTRTPESEFP